MSERFFGRVVLPESTLLVNVPTDGEVQITNVALAPEACDSCTLLVKDSSTETAPWLVACSLTVDRPQWCTDLRFSSKFHLRVDGAGIMHVTGYQKGGPSAATEPVPSTAPGHEKTSKKRPRQISDQPASSPVEEASNPESPKAAKKVLKKNDSKQDAEKKAVVFGNPLTEEREIEPRKQKKQKNKKKQAEDEPETGNVTGLDGVGIPVSKPKVKHLGGGLTIKDKQLGMGNPPNRGKQVKILYEGRLDDGTVFDSNQNRRRPLSFRLGLREVVAGMDKGLEGMKVGGIRDIKIPPAMGYGNRKTGPIPANSTLHFTVELIGIGGK